MFPWRFIIRRRVIVNLVDGSAIAGVLYRRAGSLLVLKDATYLEKGADPLALDGDTIIERPKVLFIQAA